MMENNKIKQIITYFYDFSNLLGQN